MLLIHPVCSGHSLYCKDAPEILTRPCPRLNDLLVRELKAERFSVCVWLYSNVQDKRPVVCEHKPYFVAVGVAAVHSFSALSERGCLGVC